MSGTSYWHELFDLCGGSSSNILAPDMPVSSIERKLIMMTAKEDSDFTMDIVDVRELRDNMPSRDNIPNM